MPDLADDLAELRAEFAGAVDPETLARFDEAVARREAFDDARQLLAAAHRRLLAASPPGDRTEPGEWTSTARTYVGLALHALRQAGQ